jgi:hypothetical protein
MSKRLMLAVLFLSGCPSPEGGADASISRDASAADGGGLLDDAGTAVADASAVDAAMARVCDGECDPRASDCTQGTCALVADRASCQVSAGSVAEGGACMYTTECAPGLACFEAEAGGVCGRVCCPGDTTCGDEMRCGGSGILVDGTETTWGACTEPRSCDVLDPSTCAEREGCYIVDSQAATECLVSGTAGAGEPCMAQQDCQAGFFCGGITATRCVRICRIGGDDCPASEGRCIGQVHTPEGSGLCTIDPTTAQRNAS